MAQKIIQGPEKSQNLSLVHRRKFSTFLEGGEKFIFKHIMYTTF